MSEYFGYKYRDSNGNDMHEFHVDDIEHSYLLLELKQAEKGGWLSVRMPEGAVEHVEWGHDEVVAHEKALPSKCWHGSNGEVPLRPKDLGTSRHLSAVCSRQFGWNPKINHVQLDEINLNRRGRKYLAEEQATLVYGSADKGDLTVEEGSFYWSMRPGANNDGYWNLAHFVIQLENIMDVCDVLYPHLQHVISLDHSNNHGGKRVGGLDANVLNVTYGGSQLVFDSTKLVHKNCFGNHPPQHRNQLAIGETQFYSFRDGDDGPFWLTAEERESSKYDVHTGVGKRRKRTKKELLSALREAAAVLPQDVDKKTAATIRTFADRNGIPITETSEKVVGGWVNKKPKGLLQLCRERRLIEVDCKKGNYTKADLKNRLMNCQDFKTELTLVEWVARKRGWQVLFSPKAHPEIAGVGIEYVWAVAKGRLKLVPLDERKGRERFDTAFQEAFGRESLTHTTVRGCARAARQYVQAYILAHAEQLPITKRSSFNKEELEKCVDPVPLAKINTLKKQYKTHRSVADTNKGQVQIIMALKKEQPEH
jgi:hypothetical protein